ncbi:MAG: hypothetical protein CMN30_16330 [Sandaracinus sp.]|nr:hypothetical protein [Sandaracinus sp.]|tara:strand:+ start:1209 stop:2048 length:840 start_codon:yes stop_codon:yes gene_type:complete
MSDSSTRPTFDRIALVFDWDGTLAADSYDAILRHKGEDPERFRAERLEPLVEDEGWEGALARLFLLEELGVTEDDLRGCGEDLELLPGVDTVFDALRDHVAERIEGVDLELYIVSAGLMRIIEASPASAQFDKIWACECHFDDEGRVRAAKKIVTHAEKANYLLQIARGLDEVQGNPPDPFADFDEERLHVPIDHMVYVGDGLSDLPAFALMAERGGIALALNKDDGDWSMSEDAEGLYKVDNILRPDYSEGSDLRTALCHAVDNVVSRIAIRRLRTHD